MRRRYIRFGTRLLRRQQRFVVLDVRARQELFYDLAAERIQVRHQELAQFLLEETVQNLRTGIIGFVPDLRLGVHLQEPPRDALPRNLQGVQRVAEQGTARRLYFIALELGIAASRQVFPGDPLWHEARVPAAHVLV